MTMPSILIVDDNSTLLELFEIVLKRSGYQTYTASGGRECLALLKNMLPDLILLDLMMEPMDGWETLAEIKKDVRTNNIPIIAVTGKQPTSNEIETYMDEIEGYVIKPLTVKGLSDLVLNFFKRRDAIENELETARKSGFDQKLLEEYRNLYRSIPVGKIILKLIGRSVPFLETELKRREERIEILQHQLGITIFPQ
ncbi:MAG: response regulator [Methanoregulaceae archaeon]|jgi:CheY-like chemotaxis protein